MTDDLVAIGEELRDRVVSPTWGRGAAMGYSFRARLEHRLKRGRDQWRYVGEYRHVIWADSGPGMQATHSRWQRDRVAVVEAANHWLDAKEYDPREHAVGYV